jgi:hypothetical protein
MTIMDPYRDATVSDKASSLIPEITEEVLIGFEGGMLSGSYVRKPI